MTDAVVSSHASLRLLAEEYVDKQLAIVAPAGVNESTRERLVIGAMRVVDESAARAYTRRCN